MMLALALLMLHPQALPLPAPQTQPSAVTAEATAPAEPIAVVPPSSPATASNPSTDGDDTSATVSYEPGQLTPVPLTTVSSTPSTGGAEPAEPPAPAAYIRAPNMTSLMVSVAELRTEAWRKRKIWYGLAIAGHSAAGFDAWSTNHEIATGQGRELDPLMKPFAGNASIYIATQVGPAILDYVGKRMMYSRHAWMRHVWWLPQTLGTAGSLFTGVHNLTVHAAAN